MMNYIWSGMICIGIIFACINHNLAGFTDGLLDSCTRAVEFVIGLAGVMAVWTGIMKIAERSGLIDLAAKKVMPLIKYLFPKENDKETIALIMMSFTANIFGAGNSATVFSLKVMERLDNQNNHNSVANNSMCMFIALSMSMVQLVPITVIQIRTQLGSQDSASVIVPSIIVGLISMAASVIVCKFYEYKGVK
ncbi:nucleoside recognition domain-containing protein [Clostridium aminobutyricum]|uniref:Spore maturation protein n=1 Tax=Clostridium aminobutyricum TaxID=33953 RepID=A0A939DBJ3_CLOAM|nr:nucleoside recognition domain-containing protein [Clostridium aminobutyricum]MBN7774263.1 spore maturation protein [Clostridium aminobutyricum]